jgi:hypothetical protein
MERDRKRELERTDRDGRRWGERRGIRWEDIEEQDWNRDGLSRPDTGHSGTGYRDNSDACRVEEERTSQTAGKEVTIIIRVASVLFALLQVILRFKDETIKPN